MTELKNESDILIVIPSRFASTRLPRKPLIPIAGKEMVLRVAEIAKYVCQKTERSNYVVATDHNSIFDFCKANNVPVTMTSESCKSGTERCWAVASRMKVKPKLIINLQGDNPLCPPWFILEMIEAWKNDEQGEVFTPCIHLSWDEYDRMKESKKVTPYSGTTVEIDKLGYALTFSKAILPVIRNKEKMKEVMDKSPVRRHIGLYSYTYEAIEKYFKIEPSPYEISEKLEQMRFLHHRISVKTIEVSLRGRKSMSGVDSPEDIERAEAIIKEFGEFDLSL